jgi:inorganic pyrophosphatase
VDRLDSFDPELKCLNVIKLLEQVEYFFISYNRIDGKKFKVLAQGGPNKARKLIEQAEKKYAKEK